jgi:hypothetical protein
MAIDKDETSKLSNIAKCLTITLMRKCISQMHRSVLERSFPMGSQNSVGTDGRPVANLDGDYARYKSGTVVYTSERSRQAAFTRRAMTEKGIKNYKKSYFEGNTRKYLKAQGVKLGAGGKGPFVEGRRLGVRKPFANQQLSGATMLAFQWRAVNPNWGQLYFTDRQDVAAALENRNHWIMPTEKETENVLEQVSKALDIELEKLPKDLATITLTINV